MFKIFLLSHGLTCLPLIELLFGGLKFTFANGKQIIFPDEHLMPRLFTPSIAGRYEELYKENGVKFLKVCFLITSMTLHFHLNTL